MIYYVPPFATSTSGQILASFKMKIRYLEKYLCMDGDNVYEAMLGEKIKIKDLIDKPELRYIIVLGCMSDKLLVLYRNELKIVDYFIVNEYYEFDCFVGQEKI